MRSIGKHKIWQAAGFLLATDRFVYLFGGGGDISSPPISGNHFFRSPLQAVCDLIVPKQMERKRKAKTSVQS